MVNNGASPAASPGANPMIYIRHHSVPVYHDRTKPFLYPSECAAQAAGGGGFTVCSAWIEGPLDPQPPEEHMQPDPPAAALAAGTSAALSPAAQSPAVGAFAAVAAAQSPAAQSSAAQSPTANSPTAQSSAVQSSLKEQGGENGAAEAAENDCSAGEVQAASGCLAEEAQAASGCLPQEAQAASEPAAGEAEETASECSPAERTAGEAEEEHGYSGGEPLLAASPSGRGCLRRVRIQSSPFAAPIKHGSVSRRKIRGLLHYRKWWFFREVGISVEGKLLTGTPIFLKEDTLRIVNGTYSYFIPMDNVDYIRTPDGYREACAQFSENPLGGSCQAADHQNEPCLT